HQILKRFVQEFGIGINFGKRVVQEIFRGDVGLADGGELRLEQTDGVAQRLVDVYFGKFRRGHFGEIAEAADDVVEVGELRLQSGRRFADNLLKFLGAELTRTLQIFHSDLQREEWVAQLVSQPAGQFAPGGDALRQ